MFKYWWFTVPTNFSFSKFSVYVFGKMIIN